MKTPTSIKLSHFSAIRTKIMLPAIVVLAAMLNACSNKEEPTPVQQLSSKSNSSAGRAGYETGLEYIVNGNDITVKVGFGAAGCGGNTECLAETIFTLYLGRYPGSQAVIENFANEIEAVDYGTVANRVIYSEEARQNIISLYVNLLGGRTPSASEIAEWQEVLSKGGLKEVVYGIAESTEAQNRPGDIDVDVVFLSVSSS